MSSFTHASSRVSAIDNDDDGIDPSMSVSQQIQELSVLTGKGVVPIFTTPSGTSIHLYRSGPEVTSREQMEFAALAQDSDLPDLSWGSKKKSHPAWKSFEQGITKDRHQAAVVICKACGQHKPHPWSQASKGNGSLKVMHKHLESCGNEDNQEQDSMHSFLGNYEKTGNVLYSKQSFIDAQIRWVVSDNISFMQIESPAFCHLMQVASLASGKLDILNRKHVSSLISIKAKEARDALGTELRANASRISLSLDG